MSTLGETPQDGQDELPIDLIVVRAAEHPTVRTRGRGPVTPTGSSFAARSHPTTPLHFRVFAHPILDHEPNGRKQYHRV
jgi:hypothetical protein